MLRRNMLALVAGMALMLCEAAATAEFAQRKSCSFWPASRPTPPSPDERTL